LEKFIEGRSEDAVGGVLGPGKYIATTNFMVLGRKSGERRIPPDVPRVERIWQEYGRVRGKERLQQLVDSSFGEAIITILLKNANFIGTARLMDAIREYKKEKLNRDSGSPGEPPTAFIGRGGVGEDAPPRQRTDTGDATAGMAARPDSATSNTGEDVTAEQLRVIENAGPAPAPLSVSFAGDVAVSQTLIDAIVRTQVQSVLGSLLGILAVTVILGRSLRFGILCVIPCSIAVLMNFAAMGWLSIPLGVATSMFASMALGIGVDYAIHLQSHWRRLRAEGHAKREALIESIATTGPAILIDTLAVSVGFGILTLSQVPANARLGGLVVLSIGTCFVATILVLPALLATGSAAD